MPSPLPEITSSASASEMVSGTNGTSSPERITSRTWVSSLRPRLPPGCERAKSSGLKPRASSAATARASPSARAAVVLAVGASPSGQASSATAASRWTSAWRASVESALPVIAISLAPRRFASGTMVTSSVLSPEFDRAIITSSAVIMPRSPWLASAGCTKKAGVPVLASVAAILWPTWPDFPMPLTTTRPRHASRIASASAKLESRRDDKRGHCARFDVQHALAERDDLIGGELSQRRLHGRGVYASVSLDPAAREAEKACARVGRIIRGQRCVLACPRRMHDTLQLTLILLAAAVLVVVVCRQLKLPPLLGYLLVGIAIGPNALGWLPDDEGTRSLAEFGVVFLMFSIGLEFSLSKLATMRSLVFGLGAAQVVTTLLVVLGCALLLGLDWKSGFALGGAIAMSSTAILGKLLAERLELNAPHGRQIMGVLLFQDLAVVPLLIILPTLTAPGAEMAADARRRRGQGRPGAGAAARHRPAADAPLVPPGGLAQVLRAVRAQRAAHHAAARVGHRTGRAVARARRLHRRNADLGNRVPLPGGGGHQAVPGRAAGTVLRDRRDAARSERRAGARAHRRGAAGRDARRQGRAGAADRARHAHRLGHRAAHRARARGRGRVRLRAARAGRRAGRPVAA